MHDDVAAAAANVASCMHLHLPLAKCAAMLTCNFPRGKSISPPAAWLTDSLIEWLTERLTVSSVFPCGGAYDFQVSIRAADWLCKKKDT